MICKPKCLIFDLGNTILPFGEAEVYREIEWWREFFYKYHPDEQPFPEQEFCNFRREQILRPYQMNYRENDFVQTVQEILCFLKIPIDPELLNCILWEYRKCLKLLFQIPEKHCELLRLLKREYRLGMVTNYPCPEIIQSVLQQSEIWDLFDCVTISGMVGYIKPHPLIFETILENMKIFPEESWFIGDNWLADIQGAGAMGFTTILTTQYASYEGFVPYPGDRPADASIKDLSELLHLLKVEYNT